MSNLTFNNVSADSLGLLISGEGTFNAPALDGSSYTIPGRNGTLFLSNKRYNNITVKYPALLKSSANAASLRAWLLSTQGYKRLSDDYHIDEFRMARYSGGVDFDMWFNNLRGEVTLSFDCKPQRFLTSGEATVSAVNEGTITNPTQFDALPLIQITGSGAGELDINGYVVTFSDIDGSVTLDCDIMDAYKGLTPKNNTMSGEFPILSPGSNGVEWDGGITAVSITPRWWRL